MSNAMKTGTMRIGLVSLLLMMAIVFVPQAVAKDQYAAAMGVVYGIDSCTTCHKDPNDRKSLTEYGSQFRAQDGYKSDSMAALGAIGAPPDATNTATEPVSTQTVAKTTPVVTQTVAETTPVVIQTSATGTTPVVTNGEKQEAEEKSEEDGEKEETSEKSPGFDIIVTIGIVSALYILRRYKIGKW